MNKNEKQQLIHTAMIQRFESEISTSKANLAIYFDNPAGIGEHENVVQEMVKLTRKIADAQGCIDSLNEVFADLYPESL